MQTLDELFKNKLEDHTLTPATELWTKVEANLSKKNKTMVWVKMAAAFLFASSLIGSFQLVNPNEYNQWAHVKTKSQKGQIEKFNTENGADTISQKTIQEVKPVKNNEQFVDDEKKLEQQITEVTTAITPIQSTEQIISRTVNNSSSFEIKSEAVAQDFVVEKPIVIEYVLKTISTPLVKTTEETTQTKSNFQKVVDFARDAKNGESTLGLRQAKDDLFAMNFKKEKSKRDKNQ